MREIKRCFSQNKAMMLQIMQLDIYNVTKITFLLFKPLQFLWDGCAIPYPICSIKSGMYTAFMQTGPDGPAYCPTCISVNTSDREKS